MKHSAIKGLPEDDCRLTKCAKLVEITTTISSCLIPQAYSALNTKGGLKHNQVST
ncbi:MAG: hypothetical protein ACNYZG_07350 [Gammaproteobacteria bacterium]